MLKTLANRAGWGGDRKNYEKICRDRTLVSSAGWGGDRKYDGGGVQCGVGWR